MSAALSFVQANLEAILAIVGGIAAWLIARPWAQAKRAEAESFINANNLKGVELLAASVVTEVYVNTVRMLKDTPAWTDEMKKKILADAVEILKREAKEHGLEIATAALPGIVQKAVLAFKPKGN